MVDTNKKGEDKPALLQRISEANQEAEREQVRAEKEKRSRENFVQKLLEQNGENEACRTELEIAVLRWNLQLAEQQADLKKQQADLETKLRVEAEKHFLVEPAKEQKQDLDNDSKAKQHTTTIDKVVGPIKEEEKDSKETSQHATTIDKLTKYKKKSGTADMKGELFELKGNMLLFSRLLRNENDFLLASNMEAAGEFDDVVAKFGGKILCIQFKHKNSNDKNLNDNKLTQPKGKLSIFEYCRSYHKLKSAWSENKDLKRLGEFEDAIFILYTNVPYNRHFEAPDNSDSWQHILNTGEAFFTLNEDTHPNIYQLFKILPDFKKLLRERTDDKELLLMYKLWDNSIDKLPKTTDLDRMQKKLEDLGDLSDYKSFLSHFWVFSGQAREENLNGLIKDELKDILGTNEINNTFTFLYTCIEKWWKGCNYFLDRNTRFWYDIMHKHKANISEPTLDKLKVVNVTFKSEELSKIARRLQSKHKLYYISVGNTKNDILLSGLKVYKSIETNHFIIDSDTLRARNTEVFALWGKWYSTLIILKDGNINMDLVDYNHRLRPNARLIIVGRTIKANTMQDGYVFHDKVLFSQFTTESQDSLLSARVTFQGYNISFKDLVASDETIDESLSTDVIFQMNGDCELGNTLTSDLEYYLPRTLQLKNKIRKEVLLHPAEKSTVIAVSNVENLPQKCEQMQIKKIESENDFIAHAQTYKTVHWLKANGNAFEWVQSKGDMTMIQQYQSDESTVFGDISSILDIPYRTVILSAEPGMGKSSLMTHLALGTKQAKETLWVIYVDINKYTRKLEDFPENLTLLDVTNFLLYVSNIPTEFEKIFRNKLKSMHRVCILIDGFDEITPLYESKVIHMLQILQKTKLQNLWVTTRPTMRAKLEQRLSSLAFTLKPFCPLDQQNFFIKFWKSTHTLVNESVLREFAVELLDLMAKSLKDKDRQFTEIPLQSMLIAEVFKKHLANFIRTGKPELPPQLDLLKLYDMFVEEKYRIYFSKNHIDITKAGPSQDYADIQLSFKRSHMSSALLSLFPAEFLKPLSETSPQNEALIKTEEVKRFITMIEKGQEKVGIIKETAKGKPIFNHKTFAEYFAGLWFAEHYKHIQPIMIEKLLNSNYLIVRNFFDRILCQKFALHKAVINHDLKKVMELSMTKELLVKDEGGRTPLFLAVINYIDSSEGDGHNEIKNKILQTLLNHSAWYAKDHILKWTPLYLAVHIEAWYAVGLLLEYQPYRKHLPIPRKHLKKFDSLQNIIRIATQNGFVRLIQMLIEEEWIHCNYRLVLKHKKTLDHQGASMLHNAAQHGQLEMVEFLVKAGANIDTRCKGNRRTPLMWAAENGEIKVMKYLLHKRASAELIDLKGNTALLRAAEQGMKDAVCLLLNHLNIRTTDKDGNNILCCAAKSGNADLVKFILWKGLQINYLNRNKQTPLWIASKFGHLDVIKSLIGHGADVNKFDDEHGYTPLHIASMWGHLEVVKYLVEHKADINKYDFKENRPIDRAKKYKQLEVVQYLSSKDNSPLKNGPPQYRRQMKPSKQLPTNNEELSSYIKNLSREI